jgi:hypothetical protein
MTSLTRIYRFCDRHCLLPPAAAARSLQSRRLRVSLQADAMCFAPDASTEACREHERDALQVARPTPSLRTMVVPRPSCTKRPQEVKL